MSLCKNEQTFSNDGNNPDEIKLKEYNNIKYKADQMEKQFKTVLEENMGLKEQVKEQAQQLIQMKSILNNFQNQIKGISEIKTEKRKSNRYDRGKAKTYTRFHASYKILHRSGKGVP